MTETDDGNVAKTRIIVSNKDNNDENTLYIIDGKVVDKDNLSDLSTDNIESITVNRKNNVVYVKTTSKKSDGESTTTTVTTTTTTFND